MGGNDPPPPSSFPLSLLDALTGSGWSYGTDNLFFEKQQIFARLQIWQLYRGTSILSNWCTFTHSVVPQVKEKKGEAFKKKPKKTLHYHGHSAAHP